MFCTLHLVMDYFNEFWLGFVTADFIKRCVDMSLATCDGCRDGKISPLLHMHHQLGLKDKITYHMESVRGALLPNLHLLYEEFKQKLTSNSNMDKDAYISTARFFLISATPESLYYGRYLNEVNDSFIHYQPITEKPQSQTVEVKRGIKRSRKNKTSISQNVSGESYSEDL